MRYGTWISSIPEITDAGTYTLNAATSPAGQSFKIASPNSTTEYYVVEYRYRTGTFETSVPGSGLIVSRINTDFDGWGNADYEPPGVLDEVYIYRPDGTTAANGKPWNAHFSSGAGRTAINDATNPSGFLSDGTAGGLDIWSVGGAGTTISFKFGHAPEMDLQRPAGASIADGGGDNAGEQTAGPAGLTYTVANTGTTDLVVTAVTASNLVNASGFSAVTALPLTVPAAGTAGLSVSFNVTAAGAFGFDMDITGNDSNENPYDVSVSGSGLQPYVTAKVHAWLEGPYQTGSTMTTSLKTAGSIPTTSPYADGRTAVSIPDGVTDWVSVELRTSAGGSAAAQRSFFIKSDGNVVDTDGSTTDLQFTGQAAGDYFIVLRHRNHLAVMSASTRSLSASPPAVYDFGTGLAQVYGTDDNRAKLLEAGVYGMTAADANGTGTVDANDRSAAWNDRNKTGYEGSDCNLSGTVDANDRSTAWNNRNRTTSVP
jgi:hypothetical protein